MFGHTEDETQAAISLWESKLTESKLSDFIEKNKLSKEDALNGDNFKQIKKLVKQGDKITKAQIENYFEKAGKASTEKDSGTKSGPVPPKVEKAIDAEMEKASPKDIGAEASTEAAASKAASAPIGEMNIFDRLRRLHNATVINVQKKLAQFLGFAKSEDVIVENSCVENGKFALPDDGMMAVTVKVRVNDANRKGFKKFVAGVFGKALNEGVVGDFFGGLWKGTKDASKAVAAGAKEGAQKAAKTYQDNIKKVNEEMKVRIGVAAIQEYVQRFCGKALAKKVSASNIQSAVDEEFYSFTGVVKVTQ